MPKKKNENQKTKEHFEEKEPAVVENSDNEDDVSIQDVFDFCDMLLDASFFKGEHDKEVFMELRKIIDSAYARRNKSKQDEDNYDEIIYNLTTNCIEDESLQDFMGYAYKKGKYDLIKAEDIANKYLYTIEVVADDFCNSISEDSNKKIEELLDNIKYEIMTNDGIEINTITRDDIVWSIAVFFFNPAIIPKIIPSGTEITTEITFTFNVAGSLSAIIPIAE